MAQKLIEINVFGEKISFHHTPSQHEILQNFFESSFSWLTGWFIYLDGLSMFKSIMYFFIVDSQNLFFFSIRLGVISGLLVSFR